MGYSPTRLAMLLALVPLGASVMLLLDPSLLMPWVSLLVGYMLLLGVDAIMLPRKAGISIEREAPADVGVGGEFQANVSVFNDGDYTLRGRLYDFVPPQLEGPRAPLAFSVAPGEGDTFSVPFTATDRGEFEFNEATAVVYGPLRLMRRIVPLAAVAKVAAAPGIELLKSNELILKAARDADVGISRARGVGQGGEFESLAPYVPGDPPQSVDWKAYARTGQLAVRRYVPERRRNVMLACDAGRLMGARVGGVRKVDLALGALMRVAAAALQRGDLVGLMIFDGQVQALLPPRAGHGQLSKLVRASLAVKANHSETSFTPALVQLNQALPRRALVVLATDFDNEAQGWELQRNVAQITRKHVALVAAMRDPVFHRTVAAEVERPIDAYRQLAALTLLEEREMILQRVRATGVHTLDAEPDQLTGPLLSMYGRIVTGGRF
jgi:uncharacterized protein (DUF58 family)